MSTDNDIARRKIAISNVFGLHLRTASKFVDTAKAYQSEIQVCCKGIAANGKSVLSLLGLAAECGTMLALEARGLDANDAVDALADLILARFHESDGHTEGATSCSAEMIG
jgi:phosphocarrier protein HPr